METPCCRLRIVKFNFLTLQSSLSIAEKLSIRLYILLTWLG